MNLFQGLGNFLGGSPNQSSSASATGDGDQTVDFVDVTVDSNGDQVVTPGSCSTDDAIDHLADGEPIE